VVTSSTRHILRPATERPSQANAPGDSGADRGVVAPSEVESHMPSEDAVIYRQVDTPSGFQGESADWL